VQKSASCFFLSQEAQLSRFRDGGLSMHVLCRKSLPFFLVLLSLTPFVVAQGIYTQVDYPGALNTSCFGINEAGDLTGYYEDASSEVHGFLFSAGNYFSITYPQALSTYVYRSNDMGQLVGVADNVGFLYDVTAQIFTEIAYPGSIHTVPTPINNAGTIAGWFSPIGGSPQGFEVVGASYRHLPALSSKGVYVWGITAAGELVGSANRGKLFNFDYSRGGYKQIVIPNAPNSQVYGIDKTGSALVGIYDSGTGFLYQDGALRPLTFPGGGSTYPYEVNVAGTVTGGFIDSDRNQHCFIWIPTTTR
jgi:hypothetical protein